MLTYLVLTVIGADRPGLVKSIATCIADHGGNWLESRMCRLGGQFAGILRVEIDREKSPELVSALSQLEKPGLEVTACAETSAGTPSTSPLAELDVVGQDRPGILRQVTAVLARHGLNVEDLSSERSDAPMAGGTLFKARALVSVPVDADLAAIRADLEAIATDLMVDLRLVPASV